MYIMYDGARLPPRDEHFVDVKHQAKSNAWRTWVGVACPFFFVRSNSKARHRGEYTSLWSVLRKLWALFRRNVCVLLCY